MTKFRLCKNSVLLGIVGPIAYGIVHDQITVRICPEYLTEWHAKIIESDDPTMVALAWGIVATWWFGLILGAFLAVAATIGGRDAAPIRNVVRAVAGIFLVSALAASLTGVVFWLGKIELDPAVFDLDSGGNHLKWQAFSMVAGIHTASYFGAAFATLFAAIAVYFSRAKKTVPE